MKLCNLRFCDLPNVLVEAVFLRGEEREGGGRKIDGALNDVFEPPLKRSLFSTTRYNEANVSVMKALHCSFKCLVFVFVFLWFFFFFF